MSTENEEWRENSFNEENTGAGRDGNRSYNREGGERPYRPSYNREGGDRPYRPRFNNGEGGGYRSNNGGGEVTVRDTTMTVHKEAIVLVRVPAIMIRMLSIA